MGKDWTSLTFSIDGKVYKVKTSYNNLLKNGWVINSSGMDNDQLKPNEITFDSIVGWLLPHCRTCCVCKFVRVCQRTDR